MNATMRRLRAALQSTDRQLIIMLAKRFRHIEEIGKLKQTLGLGVEDKEREAENQAFYELVAKQQKVDPELIKAVFKTIVKESKRLQKKG